MQIRWIENPDYEKTNTIYSLWLAREALAPARGEPEPGDLLFFNGDVVCDDGVMEALLDSPFPDLLAVDTARRATEEILVFAEGEKVRRIGKEVAAGEFVGLARFGPALSRAFRAALERRVARGGVELFFESALDDLLQAGAGWELRLLDTSPWRAIEIDTEQDLRRARELFPRETDAG
jgi:choline kinase